MTVGAGSSTSYAITAEGEGFAWGFGENLQLTNGEERDEKTPFKICGKQVDDRKLLRVSVNVARPLRAPRCSSLATLSPTPLLVQAVGGGQHAAFLAE